MDLFGFGQFLKFEECIRHLATRLALNEQWEYSDPAKELAEGNNAANFPLPVLRNYLEHTFRKVKSEDKIVYTPDKNFACFNTGLVTPNLEDIFAFFELNKFNNPRAPYFFKAFIKKSDIEFLIHFSQNQPESANYFDQPALLLFNPKLQLIPNIDHIIQDNKGRFPEPLRQAPDREIRSRLMGAIDDISKRVRINYKIAIPQFYDNKFQLLLPLYLVDNTKPDLALVVEKINENTYSAWTCLTMGMAYNNARLIVSPHSEWLKP
ncbi:DUF3825 domain-containing protein [Hufsiella ginkgonis]|uniref:DUF3825 domain-containing protein n=1 Tax=Hufsiella ginkgonis TaxID=2695274 RepID=A0A7K1Y0Y5_9SPHI|nr:DUF3825 domain-containing protein [Hufsiella ginkgonis]MXV16891.1 DUF3825 domain-containing protein [Hufsiella ginkgonis]